MEEKHNDLVGVKRRKILLRMVEELSANRHDYYYEPTVEIARALKHQIDGGINLTQNEMELLKSLSERDIQVILSLNS